MKPKDKKSLKLLMIILMTLFVTGFVILICLLLICKYMNGLNVKDINKL